MRRYISLGIISVFSLVLILFGFQNCAKVGFDSTALCPKGQVCDSLVFKTSTTDSYNQVVKLFFLVDNSFSMQVMQQRLSESLNPLMENLSDKSLEAYIFTTTQLSPVEVHANTEAFNASAGQRPYTKRKQFYSYTQGGLNFRSEDPPTSNNPTLSNLFMDYELSFDVSRVSIHKSANPLTSLIAAAEILDINKDGFVDANDYSFSFDFSTLSCRTMEWCQEILDAGGSPIIWVAYPNLVKSILGEAFLENMVASASNPNNYSYQVDINTHPNLRSTFIDKIKATIRSMGTSGADKEMGLCALAKLAKSDYVKPGDKAVFIILSNEEDQSTVEDCIDGYRRQAYTYMSNSEPCENASCSSYRLSVNYENALFKTGSCIMGYKDGTQEPDLRAYGEILNGNACTSANNRACTASEITSVRNLCVNAGYTLQEGSCKVQCTSGVSYPNFSGNNASSVSIDYSGFPGWNACSGGTFKGYSDYQTYLNTIAPQRTVKASTCQVRGYEPKLLMSAISGRTPERFSEFPDNDFIGHFKNTLDNKLGRINYFVGAIIHDSALDGSSCDVRSPAWSNGTKYKALAKSVMGSDNATSICSNSYSSIIEEFQRFANDQVDREFNISSIGDDKRIVAISIRDYRGERLLDSSQYEIEGTILRIAYGILTPSTSVIILITDK